MVKNKTEKMISASIMADPYLWGMKLHNNPLAHQTTPADYICSFEKAGLKLNLVEAKQVTLKEGKGRLAFKRLRQTGDMIRFQNQSIYHKSYYLIAYKDRNWATSEIYLVPVLIMKHLIENHSNVSLNRDDALSLLKKYLLHIQTGSIIDLRTSMENYIN